MEIKARHPFGAVLQCQYSDLLDRTDHVRYLLSQHLMLIIRDLDLTPQQFLDFGLAYGVSVPYPRAVTHHVPGFPDLLLVSSDHARGTVPTPGRWHNDAPWTPFCPTYSMFYSVEVPAQGGTTVFADQRAAYRDLPESVKQFIRGRVAHYKHHAFNHPTDHELSQTDTTVEAWHPLAMPHWYTGEMNLFGLWSHYQGLLGVDQDTNARLRQYLVEHCSAPSYFYEHHYRPGEILMWDNHALIHAPTYTPPQCARLLWQLRIRDHKLYDLALPGT